MKTIGVQRGVCGNRPTFIGTRLEPSLVWRMLEAGHSEAEIIGWYPSLARADILLAKKLLEEAKRHLRDRGFEPLKKRVTRADVDRLWRKLQAAIARSPKAPAKGRRKA